MGNYESSRAFKLKGTYNIGNEGVLLDVVAGQLVASQQLIRFQVENEERVGCDLAGIVEDVGQTGVQDPKAIAGIGLHPERGDDGGVLQSVLGLLFALQGLVRLVAGDGVRKSVRLPVRIRY